MQVAVREFKANLSEYLARVQAGESLEITSHKTPIARVTAITSPLQPKLEALAKRGLITLPKKKFKLATPAPFSGGKSLSDYVLEERREGP
jgi:prevent-host-death family protein